ncbi:MAG: hypothetical protein NTW85_08810 [Methylococcales bacterium]|nr:hypothetical protein [Methylococcales bacterium]
MKNVFFLQTLSLIIVTILVTGCASSPVASDATDKTLFSQPIEKVQKVAVESLVVTGFDVTKQEPTYVEGFRPRKVGLLVGSGGETAGIWLTALGANQTEVKVDTAKSLVGIAGQQTWNTEIISEMRKSLNK